MGRPLFSKSLQTAPAVREPESPCPYEKWSHINPFDPDSDEFNEHAEYEAFIGPALVDVITEEDERDTVVIRLTGSANRSPSDSDESLSDESSPMAVGSEDPAHMLAGAYRNFRRADEEEEYPVYIDPRRQAVPVASNVYVPPTPPGGNSVAPLPSFPMAPTTPQRLTMGTRAVPVPIPGSRSRRAASIDSFTMAPSFNHNFPSTPPSLSQAGAAAVGSYSQITPSPPPNATPRIYSWTPHNARPSALSSSPAANLGPLTNRGARLSHTHIAPSSSLVRSRDLMV
ncbi:hypothetical protein CONPUDRAFT_145458 [Coniophora puteana RWD-64-598 SS2]|uniref:Uncharacterized protein n=1 Tax=Coniophora puteana (strain RWD-64-598) TaxID=741705 RepID=A0A5M3ML89_CONPW|nr:uncharacterized protein CONPUDRAFT_145458 [Coniophora puteana RWD-64-598 SS2]EIW79435.1 hypothetical protein CONPUDRAFT_145458 [Coniophora puteana RWD-64-598 SS2]